MTTNVYVGLNVNDYTCTKIDVSRSNNNVNHEWTCNICGHTRVTSYHNIVKSSSHNFATCKKEYFDKHFKGLVIGDYKMLEYLNDHKIKVECVYCEHDDIIEPHKMTTRLKHSLPFRCVIDSCRINRQTLLHNDDMSILNTYIIDSIRYVEYKCKICDAVHASTANNFRRAKHGISCTEYYIKKYNATDDEVKFVKSTWNTMNNRVGKVDNYHNIVVEYEDLIDYTKDMLPKVQKYKEKHNIKNILSEGHYSVDRINPYGNYSASNTRVASNKLQSINTKRSHNKFTIFNSDHSIVYASNSTPDMAVVLNVTVGSIGNLLRGDNKSIRSKHDGSVWFGKDVDVNEFEVLMKDGKVIKVIYEE